MFMLTTKDLPDGQNETPELYASFQWLMSSLKSAGKPFLHRIRTLYSWYMRNCRSTPTGHLKQAMTESYLIAILDISNESVTPWPTFQAQMVFVTCVCLINRLAKVRTSTWVVRIRAFQAGLLCIASAGLLQSHYMEGTIMQRLNQSISICTQILARCATCFTGFSQHGNVLLQLLTAVICHSPTSESMFQDLRTSQEQKAAQRIMRLLSDPTVAANAETMTSRQISKCLEILDDLSSEEYQLREIIFG